MSMAPWTYQTAIPWSRPVAAEELAAVVVRSDIDVLRASLDGALARKISTGAELRRATERQQRTHFPTMIDCFDQLLGGGLQRGRLVELTGWRSTGRFAIVLAALAAATECGEAAGLIDAGDGFDPQLGRAARIDLQRLLWVRPQSMKHAVVSAELLIQSGFPLVVVELGIQLRGRRPHEASWVRLARAAEHHGAALLVSSPWPVSGTASEAVISASRSHPAWVGYGAAPKLLMAIESSLHVEKLRGRSPGGHDQLELRPVEQPRRKKQRWKAG